MKKLFLALLLFFFPFLVHAADVELLTVPWNFTANSGAVERYQSAPANVLNGKVALKLTYDLKGKCLLGNDASAIIFDQNGWKYIPLSNYGTNCQNGQQIVTIPLSAFPGLNTAANLTGYFHARFWHSSPYNIDVTSAVLLEPTPTPSPTPSPTPTPTPSPTPTPTPSPTPTPIPTPTPTPNPHPWETKSVDSMKYTKDVICNQSSSAFINSWVDKAVEIGASHVAISQPYDNPGCGNALTYTVTWINAIRSKGLKVWHRHMPMAHEGIYSVAKNNQDDYLDMISQYIINNPTMFQSGDIFTPIPEPQNGGISGITYCPGNVCQYFNQAHFNRWLKTAMLVSELSFQVIGKTGIKIGYFGFDGFVAFGHNNPDWNGILYNSTIARMGNVVTLDHYPEAVGTSMAADLDEFHALYPNALVYIGEWGTISGTNYEQQVINSMGAAIARPYVKGFNYWQPGPGGNEALWNSDWTNRVHFDEVKGFYGN